MAQPFCVKFRGTSYHLGGCPRIAIFSQIEANSKKLPEAYSLYSEDNFFEFNNEGEKGILGQPPELITILNNKGLTKHYLFSATPVFTKFIQSLMLHRPRVTHQTPQAEGNCYRR